MIITCPDCTTRYDVDDDRFSPNGRSVRCSSCGESWFVPAPELIDVEPLTEKAPPKRKTVAKAEAETDGERRPERPRMKVGFVEEQGDGRGGRARSSERKAFGVKDRDSRCRDEGDEEDAVDDRRSNRDDRSPDRRGREHAAPRRAPQNDPHAGYGDDDEDDALFDSPPARAGRGRDDDRDQGSVDKGWRKGRQFIVEEDDADDTEHRPFFARKAKAKTAERETLRFADEDSGDDDFRDDDSADEREFKVVDADWEDVGEVEARGRGFGRKVRAERRRATALARMEDVRPLDPVSLDEEFFASLRVTPRELERAIRKARRRAEAREKNRLTPLRVLGWTAWAAAVAGVFYSVFFFRDDIVKMAPRAADAYAVIGIEANPYGLTIENVSHRLAMSTGGPTIEITGVLLNETGAPAKTPLLQAEALSARGELLARWTFNADQGDVATGASVEFTTRAPAPEGVAEVALSFAPEKSVLESLLPPAK